MGILKVVCSNVKIDGSPLRIILVSFALNLARHLTRYFLLALVIASVLTVAVMLQCSCHSIVSDVDDDVPYCDIVKLQRLLLF